MKVTRTLLLSVVTITIGNGITAMSPAWAGFDYTANGSVENRQSSQQPPLQISIPIPPQQDDAGKMPTTEAYNVEKGIDASAPPLKIYNDRYIPDTVRQKYNLPKNWASESNGPEERLTPAPEFSDPAAETADKNTIIITSPRPFHKIQTVESWRARKGENVRDILRRWSERQQVDLMWASPDAPSLQKGFSYFGKFQDAVNHLLQQASVTAGGATLHSQFRSEGLEPVMMAPASTITTNLPVENEEDMNAEPTVITKILPKILQPQDIKQDKPQIPQTKWFALSGAPLQEVMAVWAEDAGIRLIWQAGENYALQKSISYTGKFEDAVYQALNQYDSEDVRPVGQMYVDPKTGDKVLVIRSDAR